VNQVFIDYDELIDNRGGFWDMFGNGKSQTPNITKLYRAKASTVPHQYNIHSQLNASNSDQSVFFRFVIQSFLSRTITLRRKTIAEIWSALGGAWAAALMIVAFFFYEGLGGSSGKVKILRFNAPTSQKDFLAYAQYGLGELINGQRNEFYNGGRADQTCADVGLVGDTQTALRDTATDRSGKKPQEPEGTSVGIAVPDAHSLPNQVATEGSDTEESC